MKFKTEELTCLYSSLHGSSCSSWWKNLTLFLNHVQLFNSAAQLSNTWGPVQTETSLFSRLLMENKKTVPRRLMWNCHKPDVTLTVPQ
jgi:hypothetical protein